jgi:hypothetical protein
VKNSDKVIDVKNANKRNSDDYSYAHLSEAHTSAVVKRMNEGIFG